MTNFRRMAYTNPLRSPSPTCRARATPILVQDVAVQRCADRPVHAQNARIEAVAMGIRANRSRHAEGARYPHSLLEVLSIGKQAEQPGGFFRLHMGVFAYVRP